MSIALHTPRSHVRIDGKAKVTGTASFAFDVLLANVAHAVVLTSAIARGHISGFDTNRANRVRGLLGIYTHHDFRDSIRPVKHLMAGGYVNSSVLPLGSDEIHYAGQIVAFVVADSREAAEEAASLIGIAYRRQPAAGKLGQPGTEAAPLTSVRKGYQDPSKGNAARAFRAAEVALQGVYETPVQHHNPIELFGTTCAWQGDHLTVYESTRYVGGVQHGLAEQLGIDPEQVRVICPFLGGHFGSRLALSQYTAPIALIARRLGRPVRYVSTRQQCFTVANHRPETRHHIRIGCTQEGGFTALLHHAEFGTSRFDDFAMEGTDVTASLYAWRHVETRETIVRVDRNTPGPMRAPPEVPYLFALESAIDELAVQLAIDPIELRRRNDTALDSISGKPFSSRHLMPCFDAAAESFGWFSRNPQPASMRNGDWLVGYGCASAVRPVKRAAATMRVSLSSDGYATVGTAHHEIGNGLYTILATEAAERLGLQVHDVTVRLGDTSLPPAGLSGGSSTTTSLIPVLAAACEQIRHRLANAAVAGHTAFQSLQSRTLKLQDASLVAPDGTSLSLANVFTLLNTSTIQATAEEAADGSSSGESLDKLREGKMSLGSAEKSLQWSYGAHFVEVWVHSLTGEIQVKRLTGAFSAGRIINRLTALSQLRGGMVWGIGSALLEATVLDAKTSRYVNNDLAEYLIATAADTCSIEAILVNEEGEADELMGLGELGIIGVNAAIANAYHHATGKRVRTLPLRPETLFS